MHKQAVIIIHGIGEQRPMDTLRSFVKVVWENHTEIHFPGRPPKTYSKPDDISGNLELRRLTTSYNKANIRTDFFEYYWAHMMDGNKISHILAWLKRLIAVGFTHLPPPIKRVCYLLLTLLMVFVGFVFLVYLLPFNYDITWLKWLVGTALTLGLVPMLLRSVEDYVGDAARYLDSSPKNIQQRQKIRETGIKILMDLHQSGEYQRIIVVGHSLGSVIAYDILIHAWPKFESVIPARTKLPKLNHLQELIRNQHIDHHSFRIAQKEALEEQIDKGNNWLVSDLITLGSPLTYADILLASTKKELDLKIDQKEFPTCPPQLDNTGLVYSDKVSKNRLLTHDALFAFTRWTNIYFENKRIFDGDIIGGPLSPLFGNGIRDIPIKTTMNGGRFTHTKYWTQDKDHAHIDALRRALDLTLDFKSKKDRGIVEIKGDLK